MVQKIYDDFFNYDGMFFIAKWYKFSMYCNFIVILSQLYLIILWFDNYIAWSYMLSSGFSFLSGRNVSSIFFLPKNTKLVFIVS